MNRLEAFLPWPHAVLYLANVALAALLACAAALLAASACRRSLPSRYGLLLVGLVLALTSPGLVLLVGRAGIGQLEVALRQDRDPGEVPHVGRDNQPRSAPVLRRPQVPDTPMVRKRLASEPDRQVELQAASPVEPAPPTAALAWWCRLAQGLAWIWAVGMVVSLVRLLCGSIRLAAFCRGLRPVGWDSVPTGPEHGPKLLSDQSGQSPDLLIVRQAAAQSAAQVGLARPPRLFISAQTATPVTFGLFRPAVVLPEGCAYGLSSDQLHALLLHEMAHVARRDPWVGLAQRLAAALYWWCPLVHRLNRRLADVREELCDNYVLASQGDGASLAEVLVSLAERAVQPPPLPAAVGMFEHRRARERCRALEQRVRRLLSTETNPMTHMNRLSFLLIALAGLGMTAVISLSQVRAAGVEAPDPKGAVTKSPASPASEPAAGLNKSLPDARAKLNSSPTVKKIVAALLEETEFKFIETPLSETLARVGQRHGIPVRIDEPVFRDIGVGTDAPVTRVLDGVSLHSALQLTLNDLGMTYVIQDEHLVITSQDEGERLAGQGLIYADDVKRQLEQNPAFRRRCAKLTKTLQDTTQLDFDAAPLFLAVNFIRTRYGISIEVDTRELDNINYLIIEARCTLKKGMKLTSALDKMLAPLGLTYVDCGEYILVTAWKKPAPKEESGRAKAAADHVFPEPPPSENRASDAATAAFQGQARQQADDLRQQLAALQRSYDKQSAELTHVADRMQVMQAAYQSFLVKGLGDKEPAVRVWAARKLGELRGDSAFARPMLTQAQDDPDAFVRQAAATVLQQLPRDAAATNPQRPPRQKPAKPAPEQPQSAASGWREEIVQLADRIRSLDQAYNEMLAEFVAEYDKLCSVREVEWKVLVQAIDDKDVKVRVWTVRTLGELGYREALVETALRDPDRGVRRAAQESLEKIRTSPHAKPSAKSGARSNTP